MFLRTLLLASCTLTAGEFTTYVSVPLFPEGITVLAMTTDPSGNTYLTGETTEGGIIMGPTPSSDAFVTKLDSTGKVVFTRTFGGSGIWWASAIAVDPAGEIYVAGHAGSADLLLSNALETQGTSFILKLSGDGNTVLYATYFGSGADITNIGGIATDAAGNLYLTGFTQDPKFLVTAGMPSDPNLGSLNSAAFVTEISAAGDKILYSGLIGGSISPCPQPCVTEASTSGNAIAVDLKGNAYIAGSSMTTDLLVTKGVLNANGIGAFVAKINAGGAGLGYLTYLGSAYVVLSGSGVIAANQLSGIAVDATGNAYLAGSTSDPNFPVTAGAYQTTFAGVGSGNIPPTNAFAAKLAPDGSRMLWATYIGGTGSDGAGSLAIDSQGNEWISGFALSSNFPNANGWSNGEGFLVEVAAGGALLGYSARYPAGTVGLVGLDSSGMVRLAGLNGIVSGILPNSAPTMRAFGIVNAAGGYTDGRVALGEVITIYGPHIGPATAVSGTPNSSGAFPTTLGGVRVSFDGTDAPLLMVSDSQITAVVPSPNPAAMVITNGQTVSPAFPVIGSAFPVVFPTAMNQDGTVNSSSNPAKAGSIVTIWVNNGLPVGIPGQIPPAPSNSCNIGFCPVINTYQVPAFTGHATVEYFGPAPGLVSGIAQINFIAPPPSPSENGALVFYVTIGGVMTPQASVYTTQ